MIVAVLLILDKATKNAQEGRGKSTCWGKDGSLLTLQTSVPVSRGTSLLVKWDNQLESETRGKSKATYAVCDVDHPANSKGYNVSCFHENNKFKTKLLLECHLEIRLYETLL
ncbi:uncharacterized protein LOC112126612 [Cimex lectularius]|uniref:Uncharacterized protein n=1 Tax=Cimex lectularius TaxID=79782 RepID=A0A8I6SI74_CIMLE|nr:uncharacterized protein LOC112126612 [Cimex lectularius]